MTTPSPSPSSAPTPSSGGSAAFDSFAANYDDALNQGLVLSGERKDFFLQGRIAFLHQCLSTAAIPVKDLHILDFGCGTGSAFSTLRATFQAASILGLDVSLDELRAAHQIDPRAILATPAACPNTAPIDLAYTNGTFHHIPPVERPDALALIFRLLKPGGIFSFFENNPWSPATRWVMSRIPFDRDAITLSPPHARSLLRQTGFQVLRTDFLFVFPRFMARLRPLEPALIKFPLGAQYQILCQKHL